MRELFAVTAPGLEPLVAAELQELGLGPARVTPGGVDFRGDAAALVAANLHLRTATRVLARVASFRAATFPELERGLAAVAWERHAPRGAPLRLAIRASAHKSRLYHTGAIAERVQQAIGARLDAPVELLRGEEEDDAAADRSTLADLLVVVRLERDLCTVSVDSSGEPLHRRGYRLATAKAPLRPSLAAALLRAAAWRPDEPLLDPFCGSGTIAVEAALIARSRPPGALRGFACARWPALAGAYPALRARAERAVETSCPPGQPTIFASDRDPGATQAARANAQRAGVADAIAFATRPFAACEPPAPRGLVLTNPPYGLRVGRARTLRDLYAHIGHALKTTFSTWRAAVLCPPELRVHLGLELRPLLRARTGGVLVELALREP